MTNIKAVAQMARGLQTLSLRNNQLGPAAIDFLATLQNNTSLTALNLEGNELGAHAVELAAMLAKNTTLRTLRCIAARSSVDTIYDGMAADV